MTCLQPALWPALWVSDWEGSTYRQGTTCRPQTSNTRPAFCSPRSDLPSSPITPRPGEVRGCAREPALCGLRYRSTQMPDPWRCCCVLSHQGGPQTLVPASHAALGFCSSPTTTKSYGTWVSANESLIKDGLGLEHVEPSRVLCSRAQGEGERQSVGHGVDSGCQFSISYSLSCDNYDIDHTVCIQAENQDQLTTRRHDRINKYQRAHSQAARTNPMYSCVCMHMCTPTQSRIQIIPQYGAGHARSQWRQHAEDRAGVWPQR